MGHYNGFNVADYQVGFQPVSAENPRIVGKLRFSIIDEEDFLKIGVPKTFPELRAMVFQGIVDCTNGDEIDAFVGEWTRKYTNKEAEDLLRLSSPVSADKQGHNVVFPITGKRTSSNDFLPEVIFLNIENCLSPSDPTSIRLFNNFIARRNLIGGGDTVIDLCCGSGITSLVTAYLTKGRGKIYALDIMDEAVQTARSNVAMHGFTNIEVIKSDMFAALDSGVKADEIFINPPFTPKKIPISGNSERLDEALYDFGYQVVGVLFSEASRFLNPHGAIYMLYEDIKVFPGGLNAVEEQCRIHNGTGAIKYKIDTLMRLNRARVDENGQPTTLPVVVYKITLTG